MGWLTCSRGATHQAVAYLRPASQAAARPTVRPSPQKGQIRFIDHPEIPTDNLARNTFFTETTRTPPGALSESAPDSIPWSEVTIDGRRLGRTTPLLKLRLEPGRHVVELRNPARALRLPWGLADTLPAPEGLAASPLRGSVIGASDDAAFETAMGLLPGQLSHARQRGDRVIIGLRETNAAAGVAIFDPAFPGAYPFRVARPELAGPLLQALRPHAQCLTRTLLLKPPTMP